jgi:alpha-L-fucosidase
MKLNQAKSCALALGCSLATAMAQTNTLKLPPIADGPFKADWNSLTNYQVAPEWYRDAKFGIWAHWGPQCQPEHGDWYARNMYKEGDWQYNLHLKEYGHPSTNGFKDVIHVWKAERFDPDTLVKFYKDNGAKIFMALANHHDNFDLYNSKYQPWNSVALGPQKDLIGGWAAAARKHGLRFGVSVHASHAWTWYEPAQGADKKGPLAGVPYDGKLTKADGKGQWWDGLDPQDLYAQNHKPGDQSGWGWWDWDPAKGATVPDAAYMEKFFKRTQQLWDDYRPDQIYFDDTVLPFHGVTDEVGLNLAAHFYNTRLDKEGRTEAVINGKWLNETQRRALVYDIERGKAAGILPQPWQTDTCIGSWHYDRGIYERKGYKSAASIVRMLADIVSKNGNLMLSVPLRRDGQPDELEIEIVKEIGAWLKVNGEAIYATRPWKVYGEGPSTKAAEKGQFDGQKDVSDKPFTPDDIRFTQSKDGKTLYAIVLELPKNRKLLVRSLAKTDDATQNKITKVELLGHAGSLEFSQTTDGLAVELPDGKLSDPSCALRITGRNLKPAPLPDFSMPVKQDADGRLVLNAPDAELHGATLRLEENGGKPNIGWWFNAAEWVSWRARVDRPGVYQVGAVIAAADAGSEFLVGVGSENVAGKVSQADGWDKFFPVDVGSVEIKQTGEIAVTVRPKDAGSWKPVNLNSIQLTPSAAKDQP